MHIWLAVAAFQASCFANTKPPTQCEAATEIAPMQPVEFEIPEGISEDRVFQSAARALAEAQIGWKEKDDSARILVTEPGAGSYVKTSCGGYDTAYQFTVSVDAGRIRVLTKCRVQPITSNFTRLGWYSCSVANGVAKADAAIPGNIAKRALERAASSQ